MKRLLFVPVLFAAGVGWGWWSGYGWPIAVTTYRWMQGADTATSEPDPIG